MLNHGGQSLTELCMGLRLQSIYKVLPLSKLATFRASHRTRLVLQAMAFLLLTWPYFSLKIRKWNELASKQISIS